MQDAIPPCKSLTSPKCIPALNWWDAGLPTTWIIPLSASTGPSPHQGHTPFQSAATALLPPENPSASSANPSGLPMKIAFGDQTVVRDSSNTGYFLANTDTCGGNSGSPRVEPKHRVDRRHPRHRRYRLHIHRKLLPNNVNSDTGGLGEGVSKSTTFAQYIPELAGPLGEFTLDPHRLRVQRYHHPVVGRRRPVRGILRIRLDHLLHRRRRDRGIGRGQRVRRV